MYYYPNNAATPAYMQPQLSNTVPQTGCNNLKGRPVSSLEEVRAAQIDFDGSGLVKLRGLSGCQCRSRFKVFFNGNITIPEGGTPGPISLVISLDGESIEATRMIVTPGVAEELYNISSSIYIDVPKGCCSTIGVKNSEGPTITVQNANLIIERVA